MSNTNLLVDPIFEPIKIPGSEFDYCHVFPGLLLWSLEQDGYDNAFAMVEEVMASLPEQAVDFQLVEEAFGLLRESIPLEDCDEVDDLWRSPLSLDHIGTSNEKQSKLPPDLCPEWEYDYDENWIQWCESYETE